MSACCNYKNAVQNLLKYHSHWAGSSAGMLAYAYRIRLPLIGQAMCEHSVPALIFSVGVCLLIFHHCLWPESWTRPAAPLMILYYAVASVIIMNLAHLLVWQACLLLLRLLLRGAAHGLFQINEIAALGKGSVIAAGGEALLEQSRRSCLPMALSGFLLLWVFHAIGWMDPNSCMSPIGIIKNLKESAQHTHPTIRSMSRGRGRRRRNNITLDNITFDED